MSSQPKVLLINTSVTMIKQYQDVFGYPLGLMSLIGYMRTQGFDDVTLLDFNVPGEFERMEEVVRREEPDVVGLCGLTVDQEGIEYAGEKIRQWKPDCLILCGGPYASASYERVASYPFIDLAVIGEGERTFTEILERCRDDEPVTGIAGTAHQRPDGSVKREPPREPIMDMDSLPLPAFDAVDLDFYGTHQSMAPVGVRPYMAMFSSRACPYRCTYCHDIFGKTFRAMSPRRMVEIIEHLIEHYGIREFEFYDDIWNLDRDRVRQFCELVIKRQLDIRYHFPNGVRTDRLNEELLTLMARSGCRFIAFAVESPDKAIQKQIKKFNKMEVIKENIRIADRLGIYTMGFFMIGFPGERLSQVLKTCWFMITSRLTVAELFTVTPFEGTELHKELQEADREEMAENQEFDVGAYHHRKPRLAQMPAGRLMLIKQLTYLLAYAHPLRVYRILTRRAFSSDYLIKRFIGLILRVTGKKRMRDEDFFKNLRARERRRRFIVKSVRPVTAPGWAVMMSP